MASFLGITETKEIASVLASLTGYPISELSLSFLKRRLDVFFEKQGIRKMDHFIEKKSNSIFIEALIHNLIIDNTELFRDPGFWRVLNSKILPDIVTNKRSVWLPDVSSGEELFSFLILLLNLNQEIGNRIFVSCATKQRIKEIQGGIIKSKDSELNENNFKRLEIQSKYDDYINKEGNLINLALIEKYVICNEGWLLSDIEIIPSVSLILYRNSLLYVSRSLYERIFASIYNVLAPGGYLVLGVKERIPDMYVEKFEAVDNLEGIYKRKIWK